MASIVLKIPFTAREGQKQPAHVTAEMCDNLDGLTKSFGLVGSQILTEFALRLSIS